MFNIRINVPIEDEHDIVHTDAHPFCDDMTCYCHDNDENKQWLKGLYDEGLLSADDSEVIYHGRTI